jgi:polysaccharide chain length determinant protein (PEP-CTERM system associated)
MLLEGPSRQADWLQLVPLLLVELRRRVFGLCLGFAAVALLALAVGLLLPKKYTSSTTILAGETNIIAPLMEGRAVPTGVADRGRIAREVIFSRKVMGDILAAGGWAEELEDPIARERAAEQIKLRTRVSSPGANLIQISYTDKEPERAFKVAQRFADLFMEESLAAKERESREAYEFIDSQVQEYHGKLTDAESRLKEFRANNQDAAPGSETDVRTRVAGLRTSIEQARTQLSELRMREASLQGQLSGEAEVSGARTRSGEMQIRLAELQGQLDRLRLDYTDDYPDVMRLRHQIEDLQASIVEARASERTGQRDEAAAMRNPLYQELRSDLAQARSDSAGLAARITENEALLKQELERGRRVADSEADLAELTRDYEVNRDIYQDLLRRRENARVSMNLDAERRGLTFRVQEPAALPLQPAGLRLMHFALAGLVLGVLLPLGLLGAYLIYDPRPRSAVVLGNQQPLPVLVSIPDFRTVADRRRETLRMVMGAVTVIVVAGVYLVVAIQKGSFAL